MRGIDQTMLALAVLAAFALMAIQPVASGPSGQDADFGESTVEFSSSEHHSSQEALLGRETWIKNRRTGAAMSHEVSQAHSIDGVMWLSAQDSSSRDYYGWSGTGGIQMNIDEDVTDGRVHLGVIQASSSQPLWATGIPPSATAVRDPSLEIDEDYIGTYHIERNISLSMPYGCLITNQDWLPCCGGHNDMLWAQADAESIFS